MTDPIDDMVIDRTAIEAWAIGPGSRDDGRPDERDFEVVAVVTDAVGPDHASRLPAVDMRPPAGVTDESGAIHFTAHEAVEMGRTLIHAGQVAIEQARRT